MITVGYYIMLCYSAVYAVLCYNMLLHMIIHIYTTTTTTTNDNDNNNNSNDNNLIQDAGGDPKPFGFVTFVSREALRCITIIVFMS